MERQKLHFNNLSRSRKEDYVIFSSHKLERYFINPLIVDATNPIQTGTMMKEEGSLQQEGFRLLTEMIQQEDSTRQIHRFLVMGVNSEDNTYFVGRIKPPAIQPDYFSWCGATKTLSIGDKVVAYLREPMDVETTPMLVIVSLTQE